MWYWYCVPLFVIFQWLSFRAMLHILLVACRFLCRSLRFVCVCPCMIYSALCGSAWHIFLMVFPDCHSVVGEQFNFLTYRPPGQKMWKLQWFTGEKMVNWECHGESEKFKERRKKRDCSELRKRKMLMFLFLFIMCTVNKTKKRFLLLVS